MSTIRSMLPPIAQPYTEVIVGAGLGALAGRFLVGKGKMGLSALLGGVIGVGVALSKKSGFGPFTAGSFRREFDYDRHNRWGYGGFDPYTDRYDMEPYYGGGHARGHEHEYR